MQSDDEVASRSTDRVVRFRSEQQQDHFRLLDHDGDHFLIGANCSLGPVDKTASSTDALACQANSSSVESFRNGFVDENAVYNVSAVTLTVRRRLDWRPSESDVSMCRLKGKSEEACHNYIRVIAKKAEDRVLVCGTNAYKPKCRDYALLPSGPPPPPSGASPDQAH
ncbi:semaphorin-1A-like, partial [Tropilaelaps mercedesae]